MKTKGAEDDTSRTDKLRRMNARGVYSMSHERTQKRHRSLRTRRRGPSGPRQDR